MSHSILVDHLLPTPLDCVCFRNANSFFFKEIVAKKGKYTTAEGKRNLLQTIQKPLAAHMCKTQREIILANLGVMQEKETEHWNQT